jgi:hypothetical protein
MSIVKNGASGKDELAKKTFSSEMPETTKKKMIQRLSDSLLFGGCRSQAGDLVSLGHACLSLRHSCGLCAQ